jgi:GNAT superfamily N-acetyltransferase
MSVVGCLKHLHAGGRPLPVARCPSPVPVPVLLSDRPMHSAPQDLTVRYCESIWHEFQKLATPNADELWTAGSDQSPPNDFRSFAGMIAIQDGRVQAVIGCTPEPDETLAATPPVFSPAAREEDRPAILKAMVQGMQQAAAEKGLNSIHCLLPLTADCSENTDRDGHSELLMRSAGLIPVATIRQLQKTVRSNSDWPLENIDSGQSGGGPVRGPVSIPWPEVKLLSADEWPSDAALCSRLETLLDDILQQSQDLPDFLRPTGSSLLKVWRQRRVQLLLAGGRRNPCGIAAVSGPVAGTATLEYLGIAPHQRRQGRGRGLLAAVEHVVVEQTIRSDSDSDCEPALRPSGVLVTAFTDAGNAPAGQLYERCGYSETARLRLFHVSVR